MTAKITMSIAGHLHGQKLTPTDPVNRYKVDQVDEVFIIGFNVGRSGEQPYWKITGRRNKHKTAEDALSVLQDEMR